MKKNSGHTSHERHAMDYALAAMEQMELYCQAHPGSPAAVRVPDCLFAASFGSRCSSQASKKASSELGVPLQKPWVRSTPNISPDYVRPRR